MAIKKEITRSKINNKKEKQMFGDIKESKNRFKELFEHMSSGVSILKAINNGKDFIFKDFNRAAEKIEKIRKKDVIGRSILEVFPAIKDFGLFNVLKRVYKTGTPEKFPMSFYKDNRISGWRRNYVYKLPSGEIIAIYDDITRQKQVEESLKISEQFSSNLMENSPSPIIVINADTSIRYVNQALVNLVGFKSDEVLGKKPPYPWWPREFKSRYARGFKVVLREGCSRQEILFISKMEEEFWVEVDAKPIFSNGELKYLIVNWFDITNRKAIENNLKISYLKLKKTLEGTINTLAAIVETKDPYTSGHQKRVSKLAVAIAGELGLDSKTIEGIRTAAVIHDIGKINIPASILSKPGRLSDIEYEMIKTHSQIGYEMIRQIEFPTPIAEIILQHHERLNGSGYPRRLKGKDTMFEAKILAVADVVEAMSSYRPYRPPLGFGAAIEEIKKYKGKLYDPQIVDTCVKVITRKGFKFD